MSTRRSNTRLNSLPSWASYTPQVNPDRTSLADEEFQLRQRAFQHASKRVSQAYDHTLDQHVRHVTLPLRRFFLQFQPGAGVSDIGPHSRSRSRSCSHSDSRSINIKGQTHKRRRVVENVDLDMDMDMDMDMDSMPVTQEEIQDMDEHSSNDDDTKLKLNVNKYLASIRYHPTLLPIAYLHLSPSVQDRAQVVITLKRHLFKTSKSDPCWSQSPFRPAICILTDVSGNQSYSDHGEYFRDILLQCIQQEPDESDKYQFMHLLAKRSTKSLRLGYSDRLVHWAGKTKAFNCIVIMFENVEAISRKHLDALLSTIAELRSGAGVPVCVVMTSIRGRGGEGGFDVGVAGSDLSPGSIYGEAGIVTKDFRLASSHVLYNDLFQNLYTKQTLPILLSSDVLEHIRNDFHRYHGSVAEVTLQIKTALAHHFTKRGSFLSMAQDTLFLSRYGVNLAWFCADSAARKLIFGKRNEFENSLDILMSINKSLHALRYRVALCEFADVARTRILGVDHTNDNNNNSGGHTSTFVMLRHFLGKSKEFKNFLEKLYSKVRKEPLGDLRNVFIQSYVEVQRFARSTETGDLGNYFDLGGGILDCNEVDQLLAFFKVQIFNLEMLRMESKNQPDVIRHVRETIVKDLHNMLWEEETKKLHGDKSTALLVTFGIGNANEDKSFLASQLVEPRHLIASSISCPQTVDDDRSFDMSVAYNAFNTRIISRNFYFEQFADKVSSYTTEMVSKEELLQRFAFAVYQLMYCGFVVRSRRKNDSFEKGAMVFTS